MAQRHALDRSGAPIDDKDVLWTGLIDRISRSILGGDSNGASHQASMNGDGKYVAFASYATNLLPDQFAQPSAAVPSP